MAYKVPRKKASFIESLYLPAIGKGLGVTIKHFIKSMFGKTVTVRYPEQRRPIAEGYRGMHLLRQRPDGSAQCVACEMCSTVCPSGAITIKAEESDAQGVEKRPAEYEIDLLRCIFCGMCVEACPKDAIAMTKIYELADDKREKFIVPRDCLLTVKDKE